MKSKANNLTYAGVPLTFGLSNSRTSRTFFAKKSDKIGHFLQKIMGQNRTFFAKIRCTLQKKKRVVSNNVENLVNLDILVPIFCGSRSAHHFYSLQLTSNFHLNKDL